MKWPRRILVGMLIAAGLITALWWEENWRGQKIWEESCARLRAAGEPVEMAEIIPPAIPDEENVAAAPIFAELFSDKGTARLKDSSIGMLYRPKGESKAVSSPSSQPLLSGDDALVSEWRDYVKACLPSHPPIPPGLSAADELLFLLSKYDGEWEEFSAAVRRPRCRWPLSYEEGGLMKSPHLSAMSQTLYRIRPRIVAFAAKGESGKYAEGLVSLLAMSRHLREPAVGFLSLLVGNACEGMTLQLWQNTLAGVKLDERQLAMLQNEAGRNSIKDAVNNLRVERVKNISDMQRLNLDQLANLVSGSFFGKLGSGDDSNWQERLHASAILSRPFGWQKAELAAFQDTFFREVQESVSADFAFVRPGRAASFRELARRMEKQPKVLSLEPVMAVTLSVSATMLEKEARQQAYANGAVVWCAAERFRLAHGRPPDTLDQLCPAYLESLPVDPVNGGPLRYVRKGESGYIIYSIGWNETDDGGISKRSRKELDWVWASHPDLNVEIDDGPDR